jgi:signal transduction histidine kinase
MAHPTWYRSLYWRIALGFIACLAALLVVQAALFFWLTSRERTAVLSAPPQHVAAVVASDLSSALEGDPQLDAERYIRERFSRVPHRLFVVLDDGRLVRNGAFEPPAWPLRMARRRLQRMSAEGGSGHVERRGAPMATAERRGWAAHLPMAPMIVNGRTGGMVVVLPGERPYLAAFRAYAPTLAVGGIGLLLVATGLMSYFVFNPARRRLRALEQAAGAIGAGTTGVRAPESGGDEVARLAAAFNRMAAELERRLGELEESNRARRQLLADVSHELMTPLTAMRGYLETLAMPGAVRSAEDRDRYLRTVTEETERLEAIIGDLLDLARLEGGGTALERAPVDVGALCARATERHEGQLREKGIVLDVRLGPGAGAVLGDQRRLEQVVQNLVANAVRHTPSGGRITVSSARVDGRVRLRVHDTGPGIPPDHLPRVFDRFYRVDAARDHASGGSGLGLSVVKAIVERHGGTVAASSEPGQGACFDVELDAPV